MPDPKPMPPPEPCDQCGSRVFSMRRHDLGAPTDQFPFTSRSEPYWRCLVCSRAMQVGPFYETTDSRIDSLTRALQAQLERQDRMQRAMARAFAVQLSLQTSTFTQQLGQLKAVLLDEAENPAAPAVGELLRTMERHIDDCETAASALRSELDLPTPQVPQ